MWITGFNNSIAIDFNFLFFLNDMPLTPIANIIFVHNACLLQTTVQLCHLFIANTRYQQDIPPQVPGNTAFDFIMYCTYAFP